MEDLYSFQKSKSVFYSSLKKIINNNTIDETNFENKIKEYKNSKNICGLKSKILELLLYLNPIKKNFQIEFNIKYIVNIIYYLISVKGDKLFLNNGKNQILKTEDNNPDESLKGNKKLNNEFGKKK